jgi:hypothetical protein
MVWRVPFSFGLAVWVRRVSRICIRSPMRRCGRRASARRHEFALVPALVGVAARRPETCRVEHMDFGTRILHKAKPKSGKVKYRF